MVIPSLLIQRKQGKNWETVNEITDKTSVYEKLANELVSKKMNCCMWIKSIKREQRYTHVEIKVTMDNGYRDVFIVNSTSF